MLHAQTITATRRYLGNQVIAGANDNLSGGTVYLIYLGSLTAYIPLLVLPLFYTLAERTYAIKYIHIF